MSTVSTHVLDACRGTPGVGVVVRLERMSDSVETIASAVTDGDGRVDQLGTDDLAVGSYRLVFATADYFAETATRTFFPRVDIVFSITSSSEHYHVPVLLSPFAFSTYRGS
jgi:5-hydroxyisourate hydrolase